MGTQGRQSEGKERKEGTARWVVKEKALVASFSIAKREVRKGAKVVCKLACLSRWQSNTVAIEVFSLKGKSLFCSLDTI